MSFFLLLVVIAQQFSTIKCEILFPSVFEYCRLHTHPRQILPHFVNDFKCIRYSVGNTQTAVIKIKNTHLSNDPIKNLKS